MEFFRKHLLFATYFLVASLCLSGCASRKLASLDDGKSRTLIVYVHGFGGDEVLGRAINRDRDGAVATFGEFLGFRAVFAAYLAARERMDDVRELVYRYNTHDNPNIAGARVLNLQLKGAGIHGPVLDARRGFDRIEFITLSNGNLVVREAILQAHGEVDSKTYPGRAPPRWSSRPESIRKEEWEQGITVEDPELLALYRKARVFDVSPILAGAADARGAMLLPRYTELSPFGSHQSWLFSDAAVEQYETSIEGRHRTFLICGDPFTRGIWNLWTKENRAPLWNPLLILSSIVKKQSWRKGNQDWLVRFERARGQGRDSHVEYVPVQGTDSGDLYCDQADYDEGLTGLFLGKDGKIQPRWSRIFSPDKVGERATRQFQDRLSLAGKGYFSQPMTLAAADYDLDAFRLAHPEDSKYHDVLLGGLLRKQTAKRTLDERHTSLVFYLPLIHRIGIEIFGPDFGVWLDEIRDRK